MDFYRIIFLNTFIFILISNATVYIIIKLINSKYIYIYIFRYSGVYFKRILMPLFGAYFNDV